MGIKVDIAVATNTPKVLMKSPNKIALSINGILNHKEKVDLLFCIIIHHWPLKKINLKFTMKLVSRSIPS